MNIRLHLMEPWLIKHQYVKFNLGESGMEDKTLSEILTLTNTTLEELGACSLGNNDTYGSLKLRKLIASIYGDINPDHVLVTTGTSEAIFLYYHVRYQPGANVIVPFPAFQTLYEVPRYLGYEVRLLPLEREEGFRPNLEKIKSLVDNHTKVIVLNNPHNPTGVLLTENEIAEIVAFATERGIEILADEHYRFMPHSTQGLIPSIYDHSGTVAAVGSMIKCLSCVGLRVGWIIGDQELIEQCRNLKDYTTHAISNHNDLLAQRILGNWENIVQENRKWVLANVACFDKLIAKHESLLGWVKPQAGIVGFPYLKNNIIGSQQFAEKLVGQEEVSVLPSEAFELPGYFRVGFGIPPERFAEASERISRFIQREDLG